MTIYQAELLRRLPQLDCTGYYGYRDGLLHIFHGDDPFCRQTPEGFLRFYEDQFEALSQTELYDKIHQEVRAIREYVGLYEAAPQMEAEGVHDYRKLAEYGNIVLAGTYNENHGFMFTTWDQDKERSYVSGGDYSPNYAYREALLKVLIPMQMELDGTAEIDEEPSPEDERLEEVNKRLEPFELYQCGNGKYGLSLPFSFLQEPYEDYGQAAFNRFAEEHGEEAKHLL